LQRRQQATHALAPRLDALRQARARTLVIIGMQVAMPRMIDSSIVDVSTGTLLLVAEREAGAYFAIGLARLGLARLGLTRLGRTQRQRQARAVGAGRSHLLPLEAQQFDLDLLDEQRPTRRTQ